MLVSVMENEAGIYPPRSTDQIEIGGGVVAFRDKGYATVRSTGLPRDRETWIMGGSYISANPFHYDILSPQTPIKMIGLVGENADGEPFRYPTTGNLIPIRSDRNVVAFRGIAGYPLPVMVLGLEAASNNPVATQAWSRNSGAAAIPTSGLVELTNIRRFPFSDPDVPNVEYRLYALYQETGARHTLVANEIYHQTITSGRSPDTIETWSIRIVT